MKHILLSVPHRELNTDPDKPLNDMKRHKTEETQASDGGTESSALHNAILTSLLPSALGAGMTSSHDSETPAPANMLSSYSHLLPAQR